MILTRSDFNQPTMMTITIGPEVTMTPLKKHGSSNRAIMLALGWLGMAPVQPKTTPIGYETSWANQRWFPNCKDKIGCDDEQSVKANPKQGGTGEPVAPALMPKPEHLERCDLLWFWHPNQNSRCWVKGVWKPTELWNSDSGFAPWLRWWEIIENISSRISLGQTCPYNFEEISV